jgi:L-alanine-DL-glutamate epimerase-like enolase superfamily enzyme
MGRATDVRIAGVSFDYEDFRYRTPIKFGGVALDRATILNVHVSVESRAGKTSRGFGSMPLGNVWAWPSRNMSYEQTLGAMKALAERIARSTADCTEIAHPIELSHVLEPQYLAAAGEVAQHLQLPEPMPKLATLVTASPFDAAIHDAFGKLHGLSCYRTYGPEFLGGDLAQHLNEDFRGLTLDRFVLPEPKPRMPLYHLIGALDPLDTSDIKSRINDGLPETLPEWIRFNGLTHLKIKLNGDDLGWDVDRVVRIDRIAAQVQAERNISQWWYSLDFNEKCQSIEYLLEFLAKVQTITPQGFTRIQYIEQPTNRVLNTPFAPLLHRAAQRLPIVIDESLTDLASLLQARERGYTGVALKACKGQSQAVLMAAAAQHYRMFLCVQDLTCPGASLIHSAGLAAHIPGVAAIEANSRQYVPAANAPWEARYPGIFRITDGTMQTGCLTGPGLSIP